MSTRAENLHLNFDVSDFHLDNDEVARIDQLMDEGYRIVDSSVVPTAPQWD